MKYRCQYCGKGYSKKKELLQHESSCEYKEKIEEWNKRVAENKTYYYVYNDKIAKCILGNSLEMIRLFKDDGSLENYTQSYDKNNLFENENDAQERLKYLDTIYNKTFKYKPFLKEEKLTKNLSELQYIENEINNRLSDYINFKGIDFCDVSAGGIQIRGHHKEIKGYTYGNQPTIDYDFSNCEEVIDQFVDMWKELDTPERVESQKRFIADGERWGWD